MRPIFRFDFVSGWWNKSLVKSQKPARQKKSQTTSALERHRAMMNKLSAAERRRLRRRARTGRTRRLGGPEGGDRHREGGTALPADRDESGLELLGGGRRWPEVEGATAAFPLILPSPSGRGESGFTLEHDAGRNCAPSSLEQQ